MRSILAKRWVWITALFATINTVGLIHIASLAKKPARHGLTVESFEPQAVASADSAISIRFSQPMVRGEEVGEELAEAPVAFAPALSGRWSWADTRTLHF